MKRVICLSATLLLVLAILPASALALNDTPETAIVLTAKSAGHADQLVGDTGGAVRFYRIDYAGDGQPVKIELTAMPGRNSSGSAFGFKLYGPNGLVGDAPVDQNEETWTRFSMTLASASPGAYLIQVYNYTNGMAVDFNVQVSGLSDEVPKEAATPAGSTASQPILVSSRTSNVGGSILGKSDGELRYFSFEYAGGNSTLTIELKYSPPSRFENKAVGFNLYGSDGTLVAQGSETRRDGSSATVSYTLMDEAGGPYLLQVLNYEDNLLANYVLSIDGASGPIQQASDNTRAETAMVLAGSAPAARGSIGPGREATFNYFLLEHPGGEREVTLRLTVDAAEGIVDKQVGFNLYKGADLAGQAFASLNGKGDKLVASYTILEGARVTYGIQVFNYSTVAPARYTLYVSGMQ